jgi:hypothetical protein
MRTLSVPLQNAIEQSAVHPKIKAVIRPSRIVFEDITVDNAWSGADAAGILDDPTPQDVAYSPDEDLLITFRNNSGTLHYSRQGNSASNSLSLSIDGNPSVADGYLYRISGSSVYRHQINWTGPSLGSPTTVATLSETPVAVHALSSTRCAVLTDDEGGLRPYVIDNTTARKSPIRFMFPLAFPHESARTMLSIASFSGAALLSGKAYVYVSNFQKGSVDAISWDTSANRWGDTFVAVPTELTTSLCEFRVAKAYTHNGTIYMAGQFHRHDSVSGTQPYSLILSSLDGKVFSIDRSTLVSSHGYRFFSTVGNGRLYLGNCNRVCHAPVVYTFDGNGDDGVKLEILPIDIVRFETSAPSGSGLLEVRSGNEVYMTSPEILSGAKVSIFYGATANHEDDVLYFTYIISKVRREFGDGTRAVSIDLLHEALWKLSGLNMPFYSEILGKSSIFSALDEAGDLYSSTATFRGETKFSIDFWKSSGYSATGITPINLIYLGGVSSYVLDGNHSSAFKTDEIKSVLGLRNNPLITDTAICHLHGWSRSDVESSANDYVQLLAILTDEDGSNETAYVVDGEGYSRWHNTYPESQQADGNWPIVVNLAGHTGKRIKHVGMVWTCATSTVSYAARIDVISGVSVENNFDDPNTPWEFIEEEGYRLPSSGRPYIMFSQRPYDAWNFQFSAAFDVTIDGGVTGFPVGAGIVGLAENGSNYILARYDKYEDSFQLVKCRDGIETVLATEAANITLGDDLIIMLQHRDGLFKVFAQEGDMIWVEQISYEWQESDGWLYTSDVVSRKCGIYGYIAVPSFKIIGLSLISSDDEETQVTTGLGMLPLESIADFPSSGTVRIGNDLFTYASKSPAVSYVRGPHQYRQNNLYSLPYGNGYGMEVTDFNWVASNTVFNGLMFSIDAGHGYIFSDILWRVWITTDGSARYLLNRSRYYSTNPSLGTRDRYSTSGRVYVTSGLDGLAAASSSPVKHSHGEIASLHLDGNISCKWISGASGEEDTTVSDLVSRTAGYAGTQATFPGDVVNESLAISGSVLVGTLDYPEGYDLRFTAPSIDYIDIRSNTVVVAHKPLSNPAAISGDTHTYIRIADEGGGNFSASFYSSTSNTLLERRVVSAGSGTHDFRILYAGDYVSVYIDHRWVVTFGIQELQYPQELSVYLSGSEVYNATNLRFCDLSDWREAVYIDLETDGMSALSSIIQERPVESVPLPEGTISFYYEKDRDTVNAVIDSRTFREEEQDQLSAASDAIVYGANDVVALSSPELAVLSGFATAVHRFPNLDSGAVRASLILQRRAIESMIKYSMETRIYPSLEVGDIFSISMTASGTGTLISRQTIVEEISLRDESNTMRISGRSA